MFPCVTSVFQRLGGLTPYHEEMTHIPPPFSQHPFISIGNETLQQMWPLHASGYINFSMIVYSNL